VPITTGGGAKLEVEQAPPLIVSSYVSGTTLPYRSERFPVWRIPCHSDTDYFKGLSSVWSDPFRLIVVEHDIEATDDLVQDLLDCPFSLCSFRYNLYWPSTSKPTPQYAQRADPPANCAPRSKYLGTPVDDSAEFADFSGLGFVKISPECRVGVLSECHWAHCDIECNAAIVGRWHLHGEVVHDHY